MKRYESLYSRYYDQPSKEIFAHFPYDGAHGETWESPFEKLANLAKPENWNFIKKEFKGKYKQQFPILTNYLNYTFKRVQELGLINYSKEGDKACFNTGLQTKDDKDIFVTFYQNKKSEKLDKPNWTFFTFADSYSSKLTTFRPLPEIATYIDDADDLIFDTKLKLDVNYEHIIDHNSDRLPSQLQANRRIALTSIKGAVESLKDKVLRNYKVAIPHWYEGKVQLLLPLNLTDDHAADLALVVDRDKAGNIYRARTVLTMDLAYIDARLITRPDRDWLNP